MMMAMMMTFTTNRPMMTDFTVKITILLTSESAGKPGADFAKVILLPCDFP